MAAMAPFALSYYHVTGFVESMYYSRRYTAAFCCSRSNSSPLPALFMWGVSSGLQTWEMPRRFLGSVVFLLPICPSEISRDTFTVQLPEHRECSPNKSRSGKLPGWENSVIFLDFLSFFGLGLTSQVKCLMCADYPKRV